MCNSKMKSGLAAEVAQIHGRPVLQPAGNRVAALESARPLKKSLSLPANVAAANADEAVKALRGLLSPPSSPKPTSKAIKAVLKRGNDASSMNLSLDKPATPRSAAKPPAALRKKSKKAAETPPPAAVTATKNFSRAASFPAGSIAAAQREQASLMQVQRKMKIAHYGRTAAKLEAMAVPVAEPSSAAAEEDKRCSFITANSDPIYVAYHDEEWGVAVHDDKMLFELLVLSGAQVGLDWTTILKKRNDFREAFAGFDAEVVAKLTERQIASISSEYRLDAGKVRGVVDNSNRILEVRKDFGSLDKYLWGFVNHKPISTNYKSCRKIPVKTSKSESISKDMVRRGFRFVGPTVIHSFMQAAGLTNDHLLSCPRHRHCSATTATPN